MPRIHASEGDIQSQVYNMHKHYDHAQEHLLSLYQQRIFNQVRVCAGRRRGVRVRVRSSLVAVLVVRPHHRGCVKWQRKSTLNLSYMLADAGALVYMYVHGH